MQQVGGGRESWVVVVSGTEPVQLFPVCLIRERRSWERIARAFGADPGEVAAWAQRATLATLPGWPPEAVMRWEVAIARPLFARLPQPLHGECRGDARRYRVSRDQMGKPARRRPGTGSGTGGRPPRQAAG